MSLLLSRDFQGFEDVTSVLKDISGQNFSNGIVRYENLKLLYF